MKRIILLLVLLTPLTTWAQTTVSGSVKNNLGKPVIGANIFLKSLYDGASVNTIGLFTFQTKAQGQQTVVATVIGYKQKELSINLTSGNQQLNIILQEECTELNTVVITAGAFEASDEKRATLLKPLDIAI